MLNEVLRKKFLKYVNQEQLSKFIEACKKTYAETNWSFITILTEAEFINEVMKKYANEILSQKLTPSETVPVLDAFFIELQEKFKKNV